MASYSELVRKSSSGAFEDVIPVGEMPAEWRVVFDTVRDNPPVDLPGWFPRWMWRPAVNFMEHRVGQDPATARGWILMAARWGVTNLGLTKEEVFDESDNATPAPADPVSPG
jgi:hypothetical protein